MERRCKYCRQPVKDGQMYCDFFCWELDRRKQELKRRRKAPGSDGWRLFIEAQRAAALDGRRLTYGEWQTQRIAEKVEKTENVNSSNKRSKNADKRTGGGQAAQNKKNKKG